jgi:hypothetical protein
LHERADSRRQPRAEPRVERLNVSTEDALRRRISTVFENLISTV